MADEAKKESSKKKKKSKDVCLRGLAEDMLEEESARSAIEALKRDMKDDIEESVVCIVCMHGRMCCAASPRLASPFASVRAPPFCVCFCEC